MSRRHHGLRFQRPLLAAVVISLLVSSAGAFPAARPAAVRATDGLIAHWTFDEAVDTPTATDSVGGLVGTLEGDAHYLPGEGIGGTGAISLDGSGDGVLVADDPVLEPASITVALWVKSTGWTWPTVRRTLVQKGANGCEAGSWELLGVDTGPAQADSFQVRVETDAPSWFNSGTPESRIWDDEWHHVAFTFDATANEALLYVDADASGANEAPFIYPMPADDLYIGRLPLDCLASEIGDFRGQMDDLRIYDRALSATELDALVPEVPTTTTLTASPTPVPWSAWKPLEASVSPVPTTGGVVKVYRTNDGAHDLVGASGTNPLTGVATFQLTLDDNPGVGTHEYVAEFEGTPAYLPSTSAVETLVVVGYPITTTLTASRTDLLPDSSVTLTANLSEFTESAVVFTDSPLGGGTIVLGTVPPVFMSPNYRATLTVPSLSLGSHVVRASVAATATGASSTSAPITINVHKRATETNWNTTGLLQANHVVVVNVTVYGASSPLWPVTKIPTGFVNLRDGTTSLGSRALVNGAASWSLSSLAVGTHNLTFTYGGDSYHLGTTSPARPLVIGPDVVQATGVGIDQTWFYPVVDSFRDTLAVRGTRQEPISVAIRIYNASGTLVRSASLARTSGAYVYAWNGRTSTGALLPAGSYRVQQTLIDAAGTSTVFTNLVSLSHKKLVNKTVYVTRKGNQITAKGTQGTATVTASTAGYAKVVAGNGWAGVGYEFTMPSAVVYRSITFQAQTKGTKVVPPTMIGVQNFTTCPYVTAPQWEESCFDRWLGIGSVLATPVWYSAGASVTANRYGRTVRGMLSVEYGTTYIYYARIKVVYAILQ